MNAHTHSFTPAQAIYGDGRIPEAMWTRTGFAEGCWPWLGAQNANGYANLWHNRRYYTGHRFFFTVLVGDIPAGMQLDHLCRVRCCVNPAHLEPVTPRTNTLRGNSISARQAAQTRCVRGHLLPPYRMIGKARMRRCLECSRIRDAARRPRSGGISK
jgi:hypothetical protein